MANYECLRDCIFDGQYIRQGAVVQATELPNHHFKCIDEKPVKKKTSKKKVEKDKQ